MATEDDIRKLVSAFEDRTLLYEQWTHEAHLTVAAVYAIEHGDCIDRIREGIQTLNGHFGVPQTPTGGYHETITIAWMRIIRGHVGTMTDANLADKVSSVIETFGDKQAMLRYYSRDLIMSQEARYGWIEPDIASLPD